uniref:NADH-ubiquinone oxidoreductase chain 4L n=1 Tax=Cercocebus atys TaxID=9531 RepID=A0A2K5L0H9_CERAT
NIALAFTISLLGILTYRSHLISSLLTLTASNIHFSLANIIPIALLVFAACEAAVGLALLISISSTYGLDYIHKLSLLQC